MDFFVLLKVFDLIHQEFFSLNGIVNLRRYTYVITSSMDRKELERTKYIRKTMWIFRCVRNILQVSKISLGFEMGQSTLLCKEY